MTSCKCIAVPTVWLVAWSGFLSLSWLVPNHFPPWAGFHADAWISMISLIGALAVVMRVSGNVEWHLFPCLVAVWCVIPWIQYGSGILFFSSQAWLSSAYLTGLLLALLIGARWERATPNQLADALFAAITAAAIASVGLELATWLGVMEASVENFWTMGYSGGRVYANLGQPNLLASLLLWGMLGLLWAYLRRAVSAATTILACVFLLLGITLTQSRMAYVALTVILATVWIYRGKWPSLRIPEVATLLYFLFLLSPYVLQWIDAQVLLGEQPSYARPIHQTELRLRAWSMLWSAALRSPWIGYGWTEIVQAQMAVADNFPSLGAMFGHSHNLILDMVLWVGIPIAVLSLCCLIWWAWVSAKALRDSLDVTLFMVLIVIGTHAMLEYPLQYAYFLIPSGLVIGVLNTRLGARVILESQRWALLMLWTVAAAITGLLIRDYMNVQASYNALRFERAGIEYPDKDAATVPNVLLLTQFREWFQMTRSKPQVGMTQVELSHRERVTRVYPSPGAMYLLALAYGLNEHPEDAIYWTRMACKLADEAECATLRQEWNRARQSHPSLRNIEWPISQ